MFGLGMWELLLIAVIALLALGPEKLPEAAKTLSKGIRDFRRQTRELQDTLQDDTEIGDAIRDLQSALRGEEPSPQVRQRQEQREAAATGSQDEQGDGAKNEDGAGDVNSSSDEGDKSDAAGGEKTGGDNPMHGLDFKGFPARPFFQPPTDVVSRDDSPSSDSSGPASEPDSTAPSTPTAAAPDDSPNDPNADSKTDSKADAQQDDPQESLKGATASNESDSDQAHG